MKLIDVFNKIAKGEEPRFIIDDEVYHIGKSEMVVDEIGREVEWFIYKEWLNKEVEIIEDKKIEKITIEDDYIGFPSGHWSARNMDKAFAIKINELIEEIEKLKDKNI